MYIFIDESGIHTTIGHSTIVLVYVVLENLESIDKKILGVEHELGIQAFHWSDFGSKKGWKVRNKFIDRISSLDFKFKIAVIKNPVNFEKDFMHALFYLLTEHHIKKIVIDGKKPKTYRRNLKKSLRDKNISVKKIITANDFSTPVLRLSDALAGLLRVYYDRPNQEIKEMYSKVANKITAQLVGGQEVR